MKNLASMRQADVVGAILMIAFSIWTAFLSAKLHIGWVRGVGPGAGFFPFWLSIIMLVCMVIVLIKALIGRIPESWTGKTYFESKAEARLVGWHIVSLVVALLIVPLVGMYGAIAFLMIFHMKFLGRKHHTWLNTILLAILFPIAIFLFFEALMQVPLPKGMTQPLFNPIFALISQLSGS